MEFATILVLIDRHLEGEGFARDLEGSTDDIAAWRREKSAAILRPSTSTGLDLTLISDGRELHHRIFAASQIMVPRIARAITEHLTGYVADRTG